MKNNTFCCGLPGFFRAIFLSVALFAQCVSAEPIPVSNGNYSEILAAKRQDAHIYNYRGESRIFLLDFPTLAEQGKTFNRIVAMVEAVGVPRDRVMSNEELADYIRATGRTEDTFAYGNDFRVYELVVFFNLADFANIQLNDQERWLRNFLLQQKLIEKPLGYYRVKGRNNVILSLPQEQPAPVGGPRTAQVTPLARETILRHELSHAEFFTNKAYANYCRQFWDREMSEKARQGFLTFLGQNSYDAENRELMVNEAQAYLMHTPDPAAFNARKVGLSEAELGVLRQKFLAGNPPTALFNEMPRFF